MVSEPLVPPPEDRVSTPAPESIAALRYQLLAEHATDLVSCNDGAHIVYASPSSRTVLGYDPEFLVGGDTANLVHPDDRDGVVAAMMRCREGEIVEFEYRTLRADGCYCWLASRARPLPEITRGGVPEIAIWSRDVTRRVHAEQAALAADERYQTFLDLADEGVWTIDASYTTTFVNERMAEMLGYTVDEMLAMPLTMFTDDAGRALAEEQLALREAGVAEQQQARRRAGLADQAAFKFVAKDGRPVWTRFSATPLYATDGSYVGTTALITDITELERLAGIAERERLQVQLERALRLDSLGRLASGVAHDINNLLGVINNYLKAITRQLDDDSPLRGDCEHIGAAAAHAAKLTSELLIFGHNDSAPVELLELDAIVPDILERLRGVVGHKVRLGYIPGPGARRVRFASHRLEQAITNLVLNARDAMEPGGGTVTLSARDISVPDAQHQPGDDARAGLEPGEYVELVVRDNGPGMAPDVTRRAFDPFFTTKPSDRGTGLGLSIVHGMILSVGGSCHIDSELGQGAAVTLALPAG